MARTARPFATISAGNTVPAAARPSPARRLASLAATALVTATSLFSPARAEAADFDFYVLSLSWSPTWCETNDRSGRTAQCDARRRHTFIVHGLWPQHERGWPESCPTDQPRHVPDRLVRENFDIMPSAGLAGHQWRKHGTCSGLDQTRYFRTIRAAYSKVRLPQTVLDGKIPRRIAVDDIEDLLIAANPGLTRDAVAVTCDRGRLEEIRICMTKSLDFRPCPQVDRNACRQRLISIPPIR